MKALLSLCLGTGSLVTSAEAAEPEDDMIVVVPGVSPEADVPVTRSEVSQEDLQQRYHGQELAWTVQQTPSVTAWSDSGLGYGYSYFSVRGVHQARMTLTFDGAPLNDLLDGGVYSSNFADLSSSLAGLQIQRGVGTGSVGAASFVGALHLQSADPADHPGGELRLGVGSFGWNRGSLALNSGEILPGWTATVRLSAQEADGWRIRSGIAQGTLFAKTVYEHGPMTWSLAGFSGRERMNLSFYAIDLDTFAANPRANPLGPRAIDAFGQDVVVATVTRDLGGAGSWLGSVWYNGAGGAYSVPTTDADGAPALGRWGLRYGTGGARTVLRRQSDRRTVEAGLTALAFFRRDERTLDDVPDYAFDGQKLEGSAFLRWTERIGDWHLYGDAQVRHARFAYDANVEVPTKAWTFVTPKLGVRREFGPVDVWVSGGYGGREPTRSDLFAGQDNPSKPVDTSAVRPEKLIDVEAGAELRVERATVTLTGFAMEFRDEIAATGELTETGGYMRTNVGQSFRRGAELEARWRPVDWLDLRHASSLVWARIAEWTQVFDVYDADFAWQGQTSRTYTNTRPLLTPPVIVSQRVGFLPSPAVDFGVEARYVGPQQLDNTDDPNLRLAGYAQVNADLTWTLPVATPVRLQLHGTNLTRPGRLPGSDQALHGKAAFPSGYAWSFADPSGAVSGIPYVYPLAPASFDATVTVGF